MNKLSVLGDYNVDFLAVEKAFLACLICAPDLALIQFRAIDAIIIVSGNRIAVR